MLGFQPGNHGGEWQSPLSLRNHILIVRKVLYDCPIFCLRHQVFAPCQAKPNCCMRCSCVERICPAKTDGPTIMAKFICITPSTRCASCCTVAVKKRWTRCGSCNMQILYPSKNRGVENPTVSTQNTMKRFRTPTSRNPVTERRKSE